MNQKPTFTPPPVTHKADGQIRHVGFELEFSGISLQDTVATVQSALGGHIKIKNQAEQQIQTPDLGAFNIELDWEFLKKTATQYQADEDMDVWIERLSKVAAAFVPIEVVCPPIPLTKLHLLDPMVKALQQAGAVGTEESLLAAYGVHINPEIPALEVKTLSDYLKAFSLLQWWLIEAHDVDPTRRISPYIDTYSERYIRHLLTEEASSLTAIIDDYLEHNPSRNRGLDMLPMFAEIDAPRVRQTIHDSKVNARPTFHYRLPNCHIDQLDWTLANAWNHWVVVENLANKPELLTTLGEAFLSVSRPILGVGRDEWVSYLDQWLQDHALV